MKKSMLVVDDSETDRYLVERFVNKSGLFDHIYSFNDGEEAYQHFKNEERSRGEMGDFFPPSVVILDVNMPRMNGFEFLENYEKLPIRKKMDILFVALLTSSDDQNDRGRAEKFSFVEVFLSKPFKKEYVEMLAKKIDEKMELNGK